MEKCQKDLPRGGPLREALSSTETYAGLWHYGKRYRSQDGRWIQNGGDRLLAVKVPVIVDRKTWQAAQSRLAENRQAGRNIAKYEYLLSGRVTCGTCGLKMVGSSSRSKGWHYLYYRCPTITMFHSRPCNSPTPHFRTDRVDAAVWGWIRSFLTDPTELAKGLDQCQAERERENAPIRSRLKVVNDLLAEDRETLDRLLDLYLSGDFSREALVDRKARLETTIAALDRERAGLVAQLEARTFTPKQIRSLQEFAANVARGLTLADVSFQTQRRIIEDLDVRVTLTIEDGQQVAHVSCLISDTVCVLSPRQTRI